MKYALPPIPDSLPSGWPLESAGYLDRLADRADRTGRKASGYTAERARAMREHCRRLASGEIPLGTPAPKIY